MYKGGSRGESPSKFVSEAEKEEAWTFSMPKYTHRNLPDEPNLPPPFNLYLFLLLRNRNQQKENTPIFL